ARKLNVLWLFTPRRRWKDALIEAPRTKVRGIFPVRIAFIICSSLTNPRGKLRGMRSLSLFMRLQDIDHIGILGADLMGPRLA
ncbi:MAG: hypothetical protein WA974_00095, partial [Thermodesulfobacteriota bacterium]